MANSKPPLDKQESYTTEANDGAVKDNPARDNLAKDKEKQTVAVRKDASRPTPFANHAPVINPIPPMTAHPGILLAFPITATDPDGDPLTFSLINPPPGAAVDIDGNFTWEPTWAQLGNHTLTVQVTDTGGLSDTEPF